MVYHIQHVSLYANHVFALKSTAKATTTPPATPKTFVDISMSCIPPGEVQAPPHDVGTLDMPASETISPQRPIAVLFRPLGLKQPGIISFAGGLPAPEVFPVARCREAMNRVLTDHSAQALQYSTTEGYLPLREWIVDKMARYGVEASPDNILITSGAQQALDLIGKVLLDPGDLILTDRKGCDDRKC